MIFISLLTSRKFTKFIIKIIYWTWLHFIYVTKIFSFMEECNLLRGRMKWILFWKVTELVWLRPKTTLRRLFSWWLYDYAKWNYIHHHQNIIILILYDIKIIFNYLYISIAFSLHLSTDVLGVTWYGRSWSR